MKLDSKTIPKMKVADLKVELEKLGLSKAGLKPELVARLIQALSNPTKTNNDHASDDDDSKVEDEVKPGTSKRTKSTSNSEPNKKRKEGEGSSTIEAMDLTQDESTPDFERNRIGPSNPQLETAKADHHTLKFANDNLEISNPAYYSNYESTKCNAKVVLGSWFFEVKLLDPRNVQIGWCTSDYTTKGGKGDYWVFCASEQHKQRYNQDFTKYGDYCNYGDFIGCGLDIKTKTIKFWRNGKEMGEAFKEVVIKPGSVPNIKDNVGFCPFINIGGGGRAIFNFGKNPYAHPCPDANFDSLYTPLTDANIKQLFKLFTHYQEIGNKELIEEKKNTDESVELKEAVFGSGLIELQKDLSSEDAEDPTIFILAWKLKASTLWELSKNEFMNGFINLGCSTLEKTKSMLKEWKSEVLKKDNTFKSFYNFVFDYLKEDKNILLLEEAKEAWKVVLKGRKWKMFDDFMSFLDEKGKKSISRDAWQQLFHFTTTFPLDVSTYDPNSCWPLIFDEFVEYMTEKTKTKK